MNCPGQWKNLESEQQADLVGGLLAHGTDAEQSFVMFVEPPVRANVARFLGLSHPDIDDVIQDTLLAVVEYIRAKRGFDGNLQVFAVSVARNRCRSLLALSRFKGHQSGDDSTSLLIDGSPSPLDLCERKDLQRTVRRALADLDRDCRHLLEDIFLRGVSIATLSKRLGLRSVQAVYHRRAVCLKKIAQVLNDRYFGGSP